MKTDSSVKCVMCILKVITKTALMFYLCLLRVKFITASKEKTINNTL